MKPAQLEFVSGVIQGAYLTRGDKKIFLIGEQHKALKEDECPHGTRFGDWLIKMSDLAAAEHHKTYVLTEEFLESYLEKGSIETTEQRPGSARTEVKRVYQEFLDKHLTPPYEVRLIDLRPTKFATAVYAATLKRCGQQKELNKKCSPSLTK